MTFSSRTKSLYDSTSRLLGFHSRIRLASDIGGSAPSGAKEAGEDRLEDGPKYDLGAIGHWERHPKDQDELEDVVECCCKLASLCAVVKGDIRNQ